MRTDNRGMALKAQVDILTAVTSLTRVERSPRDVTVMLGARNLTNRPGPTFRVEANPSVFGCPWATGEDAPNHPSLLMTALTVCLYFMTGLTVERPSLCLQSMSHNPVRRVQPGYLGGPVMAAQALPRLVARAAARFF